MARREWQDPSILTREGARGKEYYIRYRVKVLEVVDGQSTIKRVEKWRSLGYCSEMTITAAKRAKDEIMKEVNQQVYTIKAQIQFGELLKVFKENHVVTLAVPSQNSYINWIKTRISPAWGENKLCDIGTLEIEQFFRQLEKEGLSRNYRKQGKWVLSSIWSCAIKWGFTTCNPVKLADVGGGPRSVRECRVPSLEDVERLVAATNGDVSLLIETLYVTGMRISEAAGLRVGDLDFDRGIFRVSRRQCRGDVGDTKTEAGVRKLGMGYVEDKITKHVEWKSPDDYVFTWKGEPINDSNLLRGHVSPIMERLGIKFPGFGWHTFRRLHLSLLDQRGLSLFDLKRQAGHSDIRTTQRYVVDSFERRAEGVKRLPRLVVVRKKGA